MVEQVRSFWYCSGFSWDVQQACFHGFQLHPPLFMVRHVLSAFGSWSLLAETASRWIH